MERFPSIKVHDHVWEVALEQLESGASLSAIQERNDIMCESRQYRGMDQDMQSANVRYLLLPSDSSTLYQKYGRKLGINVATLPQYNIDDWLNPDSRNYKPDFRQIIFDYAAKANAGERFRVCIATNEMNDAAWEHVHHSQLLLDGTFGVCSSKLLLFIALGIDKEKKGEPVAIFLFSAPTGSKATHAGYDSSILRTVLSMWKDHLTWYRFRMTRPVITIRDGEEASRIQMPYFTPYSVITNTDTKERKALLLVWPEIILLLCKFHVRQSWSNHRKKDLGSGSVKVTQASYWKDIVRNRMNSLENSLLQTTEHSTAMDLLAKERTYLIFIQNSNPSAEKAVKAGLVHIAYLNEHYMSLEMWQSWSAWGRLAASTKIGVAVEDVVPTTNHLESFNGVLKRKHLVAWLRSGHRLRFDFFIFILITRILPGIFRRRRNQRRFSQWLSQRFSSAAGGKDLSTFHQQMADEREAFQKTVAGLCWWEPNESKDQAAQQIVASRQINMVKGGSDIYQSACLSMKLDSIHYQNHISRNGYASCSCPDFQKNGGACKHLRALRIGVDALISMSLESPFIFPLRPQDAIRFDGITLAAAGLEMQQPPPLEESDIIPDIALIQHVGGDSTSLGGAADEKMEEDVNGEDVPEDEVCTVEIPENFYSSQFSAISQQQQKRIQHEISFLLPRLHGLQNLLADASTIEPDPDIKDLKDVLFDITTRISELELQDKTLVDISSIPSPSTQTPKASVGSKEVGERIGKGKGSKRPRLEAPELEGKQKRKSSHGYLP
ncbi:hypothetical protein VNI00_004723 [Paramarasmius palmivorus]|uniref:SWIM-type domain-containing protein n=1 Tax=Paramarasmius palmivorus TaxID=297713 RepID=A0AAW0DHD3_9AGAR